MDLRTPWDVKLIKLFELVFNFTYTQEQVYYERFDIFFTHNVSLFSLNYTDRLSDTFVLTCVLLTMIPTTNPLGRLQQLITPSTSDLRRQLELP